MYDQPLKQANKPPGSAIYTGKHDGRGSAWRHIVYDVDRCDMPACEIPPPPPTDGRVDWYDFRGLGTTARAIAFAKALAMPDMALEDALDVTQRPKYEEYPEAFLFILDLILIDADGKLTEEQVTVYWNKEFVLSFQELPGDLFAGVCTRIEEGKGRIRKRGTTYLAYALIDAVVDHYIVTLEDLEDAIDKIEESILAGGNPTVKLRIHEMKSNVNRLRRSIVPLREAVTRWQKSDHPNREPKMNVFIRDLHDNVSRALELTDSYVIRASDLYSLYTNEIGVRTNNVVQVLTVVSTIFIPLTFLTGLYGMNFANMPELSLPWAYPALWVAMVVITVVLLLYFKRRDWL